MFKSCFKKAPAQIIEYRSFKRFIREDFRSDLQDRIDSDFANFESFSNTFESVLDAHTPRKKRTIRGNQKPYITKALRKAIMVRSFLKNRANKTGNPLDQNISQTKKSCCKFE